MQPLISFLTGNDAGLQSIVAAGGPDVVHDMLLLGTGHGGEEGSIDHALMLLRLLMRHSSVAYMFTQQVRTRSHSRLHSHALRFVKA
jgi:hypothetical protein